MSIKQIDQLNKKNLQVCNTSAVKARSNVGDSEANWSKNGTVAERSTFSPSVSWWSGSKLHCVHQEYIIIERRSSIYHMSFHSNIFLHYCRTSHTFFLRHAYFTIFVHTTE